MRPAWVDATAGVAGDMLLGALLDAGARLEVVRTAIRAVIGDAVTVELHEVDRAGLRAAKAEVRLVEPDPPHRTWRTVAAMIGDAALDAGVRDPALAVFARLAAAEGRVHGIPPDQVHFHEVGALDAIADVVGVCAALDDLGVDELTVSPVALGSGTVRAAHGTIPVPVPAVVELATGWTVLAGGAGELTTPTGMALLTTLARGSGPLPTLVVDGVGIGAGSKDVPERPNVTRIVLGRAETAGTPDQPAVVLEANVDDLDPRLWPGVLTGLLDAGASDAWLTPITMKKGRPAHTLSVLCPPAHAERLQDVIFARTTTLGVRRSHWTKHALDRAWTTVEVEGRPVRIKIGHRDGAIVQAMPEFGDIVALGALSHRSPQHLLLLAQAAAVADGLVAGAPYPAPVPGRLGR